MNMPETHRSSDGSGEDSDVSQPNSWRRSISARLLISVNGICLVLLLVFIAIDYREETKQRMGNARTGLLEEAAIMEVAIEHLRHIGTGALQDYVDRVCIRMEETHSAGHHIVLRIGDRVIQARTDHVHNDEELKTLQAAVSRGESFVRFERHELLLGMATRGDVTLVICEVVDDVRFEIARESLLRLSGMLLLGVVAAVVINVVLLRIVVRPLERLVGFVTETGAGRFGLQASGFKSRELDVLSRALNAMSGSLEESDRQRRAQMQKARRIQQHLLPSSPQLPGVEFSVRYEPAEDVAGDFYDLHSLSDGSWVIIMADVTGHGIPAAMTATLLKAHFAEGCEHSCDLRQITKSINRRFTELTLDGDFASAILIRFVPDSGTLQVINAGHDAALYRSNAGQRRDFRSSGLLLGITENADWTLDECQVSSGDRLMFFTDGITETFSSDREMFGHDRVEAVFSNVDQTPSLALDSLLQTVNAFRGDGQQLDDITAILMQF